MRASIRGLLWPFLGEQQAALQRLPAGLLSTPRPSVCRRPRLSGQSQKPPMRGVPMSRATAPCEGVLPRSGAREAPQHCGPHPPQPQVPGGSIPQIPVAPQRGIVAGQDGHLERCRDSTHRISRPPARTDSQAYLRSSPRPLPQMRPRMLLWRCGGVLIQR
jgi:hypothetical protein